MAAEYGVAELPEDVAGFFWRQDFEPMQIQTNPQSRFRVTFEIHFGPHSVEGPYLLMIFYYFCGAGARIVDWSPFSLAQRRIASREREKVILIWGQTGCLNLRLFKITIFFMFVTAYPRGSVNHITFWGQSRFAPSKKILPYIKDIYPIWVYIFSPDSEYIPRIAYI